MWFKTFRNINNICNRKDCDGHLTKINKNLREEIKITNHYIYKFLNSKPELIFAREHTAVIGSETRKTIEEKFRDASLNIISCSTTMEMGIDLGELNTCICRNIPPYISNYKQRAGRTGRRGQVVPIVLTIAKKSNFDMYNYKNFNIYLNSNLKENIVKLDNIDFYNRHEFSILLRYYLLNKFEKYNSSNSLKFSNVFGEDLNEDKIKDILEEIDDFFNNKNNTNIVDELQRFNNLLNYKNIISFNFEKTKEKLLKFLKSFIKNISQDWIIFDNCEKEKVENKKYKEAEYYKTQKDNLLNQLITNLFSKYSIIPTYSFPINSASLKIMENNTKDYKSYSNKNDLVSTRNNIIGIFEYSPEQEIVAGGKVWTSRGVIIRNNDSIPKKCYYFCEKCLYSNATLKDNIQECPNCKKKLEKINYREITEFITSKEEKGKNIKNHRKKPYYSDDIYNKQY